MQNRLKTLDSALEVAQGTVGQTLVGPTLDLFSVPKHLCGKSVRDVEYVPPAPTHLSTGQKHV